MFQLVYTDEENYQYFFNLKTHEVAKIYREDLKRQSGSKKRAFMLFRFFSIFMLLYRKTIIDTQINKTGVLFLIFVVGAVFGILLYYLAKRQQLRELNNSIIDYSFEDLKKWIEIGKWDRSFLLKLSGMFIILSILVGIVFVNKPDYILMLLVIFFAWSTGVFFFCEPILYFSIYKKKLTLFCKENKIKY
ncbi:hypothetical protein [Enterococcus rivorum]|uniref:Uncharacterized protein n=1 Tax=Enterococcus rivorum TaxID=762845 RepID=A0A1E5KUH6_9ENTE|nr:hypothetical protein [Enterococcus rivorum]MBP2099833.1 hypothetical protein [Enterococcus rivorum]OEH81510.1 hypothetical protein BCR26_04520 [Enterococcus rivorum]